MCLSFETNHYENKPYILIILPAEKKKKKEKKRENFQIEILIYFIFLSEQILWVLVRTAAVLRSTHNLGF